VDAVYVTRRVDARGLGCPIPVMKTREALHEAEKEANLKRVAQEESTALSNCREGKSPEFVVISIVDNDVAAKNVAKMARNSGYDVTVERDGPDHRIVIEGQCALGANSPGQKPKTVQTRSDSQSINGGAVYLISSDRLGTGAEELGDVLMSSFLFTLGSLDSPPETLIFLNRGVYLTTKGGRQLGVLQSLSSKGVRIMSCGTCLDYYGLTERLVVGEISNMYEIVDEISKTSKVVWI
jgi:selenium metabolism protein YedF